MLNARSEFRVAYSFNSSKSSINMAFTDRMSRPTANPTKI
jgi:hypothetical protein